MSNEVLAGHGQRIADAAVAALRQNGFESVYCPTAAQARQLVLERIAPGLTVGFGGSQTIKALKLSEPLAQSGCTLCDHSLHTGPQRLEMCRRELLCDVFLTGSNAVTMDGQLYNVDMRGNRTSAMMFGPRQVIVVAGVNKIVPDLQAAQQRVRFVAAPRNALRLGLSTPCVQTGYCMDCTSPQRICNATLTLNKRPSDTGMLVVIVGEALGL
jgi:hypothetical protein